MIDMMTRNAGLADIVRLLEQQQTRKVDLVVPARHLQMQAGFVKVEATDPVITDEGVTDVSGFYLPTEIGDEGIASKLDIPLGYYRRMRSQRMPLLDHNVNGWLYGDARSFLLRCFTSDDGEHGVLRAFLSDRFGIIDNLDVLMAALDGVREAEVAIEIEGCDLTERRMSVRISCPEIAALAPTLLKGYRSPYTGQSGDDNPTVFAGLEISNSETGGGAFTLTPRLIVQVCSNGMKVTKDAMRAVHLGSRMDDGVVSWSEDTQQKQVALIRAKTRDAVRTFLDVDYMTKVIERAEEKAAAEVSTVDEVEVLAKTAAFTQSQIEGILGHFVKGGQMTVGGVFNAATAYAQQVPDPDEATEVETRAASLLSL